jgi:hypothetical protein
MNIRRFVLLLLAALPLSAQTAEMNRDPMKARLITTDIPNFWHVFDTALLKDAGDRFQHDYIDAGSPGVHGFVRGRIQSGSALAITVASRMKYYTSIREATLSIDQRPELKEAIQASFRKLKEVYPDAVFPDVYFLIGRMNSAGTTGGTTSLLIGVEMNARDDNTPIEELSPWEKAVIGRIANLPQIVAHELIHIEQRYAEGRRSGSGAPTLLERALGEGAADFLGEMISGGIINRVQRTYGDEHEQALWAEFRAAMSGTDTSKWLYEGDKAKDRPADMGYYMGYKICEAFYKKASDKQGAIRRILAVPDAEALWRESGYGAR